MQDNKFPNTTGFTQHMKCNGYWSMRVLACGPLDRESKCVPSIRGANDFELFVPFSRSPGHISHLNYQGQCHFRG